MDQNVTGIVAGEVEEEQGWRDMDGGRGARLLHALVAFAIVAALGFGAGFSVGDRGGGGAVGAVSALPSAPVVGGKQPGGSCASVPEGAWRTQLCPTRYPSGDSREDRAATPQRASRACASLPDPAWKAQLCLSLYPDGRARSGRQASPITPRPR